MIERRRSVVMTWQSRVLETRYKDEGTEEKREFEMRSYLVSYSMGDLYYEERDHNVQARLAFA